MRSEAPPAAGGHPHSPSVPAGPSVALVMTDIEESTDLWERAPEAMAAALLTHNSLVRDGLARHGGYEIKSEGDAFALAFADAAAALAWCLEVSAALAGQRWPPELRDAEDRPGLRVRMGIHVGEPIRNTDPVTGRTDFLGPAMNRAARVSAAGHGGQVLLSDAAWQALGATLPELGLEAEDLGLYTLRGLSAPERLRQVRPYGQARRRFPPLRATRWRPSSPLAGRDQFIGRATDLANIHAMLATSCRLLTIRGPGGTGKTRLARRYGAEQEASWPGGVVFCDLSEAHSDATALAAVGRALGLAVGAADAEVAAALAGRGRMLLILDNLEQIIEVLAPHVRNWLGTPGATRLLVTSRRPLGLDDEIVMALAPLSMPHPDARSPEDLLSSEAAQLYVERAMERGVTLTLGQQTCLDITALVRRLDGLPLAIELAAAWSRLLSPAQICARVSEHLAPLPRAEEGRVARQATLDAVVAWSWGLLTPWERSAFAQIAVFEGGFTMAMAEQVVDLSAHPEAAPVGEALERLVGHSLVRPGEQRGRFSLLLTLQDFGKARLSEQPTLRQAAETRHGALMLALVQRAGRSGLPAIEEEALRQERENLLVALSRALARTDAPLATALGRIAVDLLTTTGPISEAVALSRAILRCPGLTPAQRARATLMLGNALRHVGEMPEARLLLESAHAAALTVDAPALLLDVLIALALLSHDTRDFPLARARYEAALDVARALGDAGLQVRVLTFKSHLERETGHFDVSEAHIRDAMAICGRDDRWNHRRVLASLSLLQLERGYLEEAAGTLRDLVGLAQADGDRGLEAVASGNLGEALAELGRYEDALVIVRRNIALVRPLGDLRLQAINMGNQGQILLRLGRLDEAERCLREAITLTQRLHLQDGTGAFRGSLGVALAGRGQLAQAWTELEEGAAILTASTNLLELLRLRVQQLPVARRAGRPTQALVDEARALAARLGLTSDARLVREINAFTASDAPVPTSDPSPGPG